MCKVNHEFYTINLKSIHDPSLNDMVYIIQDVESQNKKSYKEVVLGPFRVESFDTMVSFTTSHHMVNTNHFTKHMLNFLM